MPPLWLCACFVTLPPLDARSFARYTNLRTSYLSSSTTSCCYRPAAGRLAERGAHAAVVFLTLLYHRQVYFGPIGDRCRSLIAFLEAIPGVPPCPAGGNPGSWMLDVLAAASMQHGKQGIKSSSSMGAIRNSSHGEDAVGSAALLSDASPYQYADTTPVPTSGTLGLPCGSDFQGRYFSSQVWIAEQASRLGAHCVPTKDGLAPKQRCSPCGPLGGGRARSLLFQYAILARREWLAAGRDIAYNGGRFGGVLFLQTLYGIVYLGIFDRATDIAGLQVSGFVAVNWGVFGWV